MFVPAAVPFGGGCKLRDGVEAEVFAAIPGEEVEGAIAVDFASPDGGSPPPPPSFCRAASLAGAIAETSSLSFSEGSLIDAVEGAPTRLGVPGPTEATPPGIGEAVPLPEGEAFEASAFVVDKNFDLSIVSPTGSDTRDE